MLDYKFIKTGKKAAAFVNPAVQMIFICLYFPIFKRKYQDFLYKNGSLNKSVFIYGVSRVKYHKK